MSLVSRIKDLAERIAEEFDSVRNSIKVYTEGTGIEITNEVVSIDINGLGQLFIPASGDFVALHDVSTGDVKKVTLTDVGGLALFNASQLRGNDITTSTPQNGNALIFNSTTNQWEYGSSVGPKGDDGEDGREVELRNSGTYIQWRYVGETTWNNLVVISALKGDPGTDGTDGTDGREVELQNSGTYIQWRYAGTTTWTNLVAVSALKGDKGDPGDDGGDGDSAYVYIAYASDDQGTDFTTTFDPNLDYIAILTTTTEIANPADTDFVGLWKKYGGGSGGDLSEEDLVGGSNYGALYNRAAISDSRGIGNSGFIVPDDAAWNQLFTYVGGISTAAPKLKESGTKHWMSDNGANDYGFTAVGSGYRGSTGQFSTLRNAGRLYSSNRWGDFGRVFAIQDILVEVLASSGSKKEGYGLRLFRPNTPLSHGQKGTYAGNDGKLYRTICIGNQEWMAENLAETKFADGSSIPHVPDNTDWSNLLDNPGYAFYDNNEENGFVEGPLSDVLGPVLNKVNNLQQWQSFEYRNIVPGVADTFILDISADKSYTINSAILRTDFGMLKGVSVKINGTAISGLSGLDVTNSLARQNATGGNVVSVGDKVTLEVTTDYIGSPEMLIGKISYTV